MKIISVPKIYIITKWSDVLRDNYYSNYFENLPCKIGYDVREVVERIGVSLILRHDQQLTFTL